MFIEPRHSAWSDVPKRPDTLVDFRVQLAPISHLKPHTADNWGTFSGSQFSSEQEVRRGRRRRRVEGSGNEDSGDGERFAQTMASPEPFRALDEFSLTPVEAAVA